MKHEKLNEALNEISDRHIAEASEARRRVPRSTWVGLVAAMLAVVIFVSAVFRPAVSNPSADLPAADSPAAAAPNEGMAADMDAVTEGVSLLSSHFEASPTYPEMPKFDGYDWKLYFDGHRQQYNQPENYAAGTEDFFRSSTQRFLLSGSSNPVCSPLNIYIALAMLAETTDGESRQQILTLLGADSIDTLRTQAGHMWNAHYCDDGLSVSLLGNSLWLDDGYSYAEDTVGTLSGDYYASIYQGDLGSDETNHILYRWINLLTGGLLQEQAESFRLSSDSVLALVSTIYYKTSWLDPFPADGNTECTFYSPAGEITTTFMNQELIGTPYYQTDDCSAVAMELKDGATMWLVLPDEGYTPADIVASGHGLDLIFGTPENQAHPLIRLSMPKFDIAQDADLIPQLQALGVTDVFDSTLADFTTLIPESEATPYVNRIYHAARVLVDEEGITGAAFTAMDAPTASEPLYEEEIDFVLDRPFLFVIESKDGIPVFCGIVNKP